MPSVQDVLRESGFTDEQISGLDQRAITAFSGVLSTAQAERERAELERRSATDFYDNQIVPALTSWDAEKMHIDNEKARVAAEAAFYRTQAEEARASGFIPSDAPGYPARDQSGRYVAGAPGSTPGSPTFFDVNRVYDKAGEAVSAITDVSWKHQQLFGTPLPISPSELIKQADAHKLSPMVYADRQFNFSKREQELAAEKQKEHDDRIRKEATADNDRKWAERVGSNPDVRAPQQNIQMAEIARGVRSGQRQDPLLMNDNERRKATAVAIRSELSEAS